MEARELRIGNWVYRKNSSDIKITTQVNLTYLGLIYEYPKDYDPIPLTEEILLKCGFTLYNNDHYYEMAFNELTIDVSFKLSHVSIWGRWNDGVEGIFIKIPDSLHKLQNLIYAITGEELDIDLSR